MSTSLVCKECGCPTPGRFAMTGREKFPLCEEDITKFIADKGLASKTILPILAFNIVETTADLQVYDEKIAEIDAGGKKVDMLLSAEQDQFEKAILALGKMKEDVIGEVSSEFDKVIQRLRNFHNTVVEELHSSKQSIMSLRRDTPLSRVTNEILNGTCPSDPNFYMELIQDVVDKLRKTIYSALILEYDNVEDFILEVLKPEDFVMLEEDGKEEEEEPVPASIRALTTTSTATPVPSPLPIRTRPPSEPAPPKMCLKCSRECGKQYHLCKENTLCLDCYERLIATECYGRFACCPNCQKLPSELYDNREKKRCAICKFRLKLNEIAHWCMNSENTYCDPCYPKIYANGICKQCNDPIPAPPR